MKKVIYVAPRMERVTIEVEAPIAWSAGGGHSYIPPGMGAGDSAYHEE